MRQHGVMEEEGDGGCNQVRLQCLHCTPVSARHITAFVIYCLHTWPFAHRPSVSMYAGVFLFIPKPCSAVCCLAFKGSWMQGLDWVRHAYHLAVVAMLCVCSLSHSTTLCWTHGGMEGAA